MTDYSTMTDDELAAIAGVQLPQKALDQKALAQQVFMPDTPQAPDYSQMSDDDLMKIAGIDPMNNARPKGSGMAAYEQQLKDQTDQKGWATRLGEGLGRGAERGVLGIMQATQQYGPQIPQPIKRALPGGAGLMIDAAQLIHPQDMADVAKQTRMEGQGNNLNVAGGIGEIIGDPKTAATLPLALTSLPARAASGGAYGALEPVESADPAQASKERMIKGGIGAVGAAVLPLVINKTAKGIGAISKKAGQVISGSKLPNADGIKAIANQKYAELAARGDQLPANFTDDFLGKAKTALLSEDDLINQMSSSKPLRAAMDDLELFKGQPMTLQRAQALDEQIGNMLDGFTEMGRLNKQGYKLLQVQNILRDKMDDAGVGGLAKEARAAWKAQAKLRDIERILQRADTMDQPATAIKTGFRQLLTNPNKSKWYSKQELKLIEKAAKSGVVSDTLRGVLGSRLIAIVTAGSGGGLGATAAAAAGSTAARSLATRAQVNRAMKLSDAIAEPYRLPGKGLLSKP